MNHSQHQDIGQKRKEHSRMLFFVVCMSFILWTVFWGPGWWEFSILYSVVLGCFFYFFVGYARPILLISILLAWIVWHFLVENQVDTFYKKRDIVSEITRGYIDKIWVTWIIEKELYRDDTSVSHRLLVDNFDNISTDRHVSVEEKIALLITLPKNLKIEEGSRIYIEWNILDPKIEISWFWKYLILQDIAWKIQAWYTPIKVLEKRTRTHSPWKKFENIVFHWFPREHAGIILGMMFWNTRLMSDTIEDAFQKSWLTHILVVSGSNIAFLIVLIVGVLRYTNISRLYRIIVVILSVIGYGSLVWWDIPVIRATVMWILAYMGLEYSSRFSSLSILFLIAIILIILEPLSVVYDAGFWLSFAATASIILYGKRITSYCGSLWIPRLLSEVIAITTAASIGTIPVTLYYFWSISVGFFFANILIGAVVGYILFVGTTYILISPLGEWVLYWFGYIVYLPVDYIIQVGKYFGGWGMIDVPPGIISIIVILSIAYMTYEVVFYKNYLEKPKNASSQKSGT